jgi:RNase H-fold protein (predicted Holliday junction resolvase)
MGIVLAIDPGREKCGMAVVGRQGEVWRQVVTRERVPCYVEKSLGQWPEIKSILIGDGTGSRELIQELSNSRDLPEIVIVDEYLSTEEARKIYWEKNPPKGWRRLIPVTLQTPPEPYDDLVALVLAQRFLGNNG